MKRLKSKERSDKKQMRNIEQVNNIKQIKNVELENSKKQMRNIELNNKKQIKNAELKNSKKQIQKTEQGTNTRISAKIDRKLEAKKVKSQKGITLLVLVITIIILLILAGITINAITDENGTIVNASKAKFRAEIRDIEEKIELEEINNNNGEEFQFGNLKDLIGREDEYNEILYIENGNLVYIENKVNEQQAEWLQEMEIQAKKNIIPIYTKEQFEKIGTGENIQIEETGGEIYQFNLDSHYMLQNDINLNCNEEQQWIPIGTSSNSFKGILDGKGYKIKGIYINGGDYKALFAYNSGTIKNIILDDGYIIGTNYIAGIVSRNSGNVENCINQIEIISNGNFNGGIVGTNSGRMENCQNKGYIELQATSGGICGQNANTGIIKNCKNTVEIMLKDFNIGGIVGINYGTVEKCYNSKNILSSTTYVRYGKGGIVGNNYGEITKCYNLGDINCRNWSVGGIAGINQQNGIIEFSYSTGKITGSSDVGGIVGKNDGSIRYNYTINTNSLTGTSEEEIENCMQLTDLQMKNKENIILDDNSTTNFLALLNNEEETFYEDTTNINKGYPIIK